VDVALEADHKEQWEAAKYNKLIYVCIVQKDLLKR
jgi:hypothetical protein